jgi:hypothetical protein
MEETLKLKCQKCGVDYEKPAKYIEFNKKYPSVFWRYSLAFCDKHRKEKEVKILSQMNEVLTALSKHTF